MNHPSSSQGSTTALLFFLDPLSLSEYTKNKYPQLYFLSFALIMVTLEFLFENIRSETLRNGRSSAGWASATCLPLLAMMENKKVESNVTATCAE